MYILGVSAFYHDSAACLLKDGEIIAAAQEERFTRKKHDAGFPSNAINYCLEEALFGIDKLNVPRSKIPAITHVDYSARIQTVHADTNPKYHAVISKFKEKTGCPLVVNTSFNVRGEPIICTPTDAFKCFMGTEMDLLAVGNFVLYKEQQDEALKENYEERYELD